MSGRNGGSTEGEPYHLLSRPQQNAEFVPWCDKNIYNIQLHPVKSTMSFFSISESSGRLFWPMQHCGQLGALARLSVEVHGMSMRTRSGSPHITWTVLPFDTCDCERKTTRVTEKFDVRLDVCVWEGERWFPSGLFSVGPRMTRNRLNR